MQMQNENTSGNNELTRGTDRDSSNTTSETTSDTTLSWYGEYHSDTENSHKFYSVVVNDTVVTRRWGRVDGYGCYWDRKPLVDVYDTQEEALASAEKIVRNKMKRYSSTDGGVEG